MLFACLKAMGPVPRAVGEHPLPWEWPAEQQGHCHAPALTQTSRKEPAAFGNGKQRCQLPARQWWWR